MSANKVIKTSVRNLVEFVLRSGDLVATFTGSSRMVDGSKIHRKIQQSQGSEYESEVSLSIVIERPDVILQISGRADGIITTKDETGLEQITVDEIKSVTQDLETIEEGYNPLHWAQAKCYAYIYAAQHGLAQIGVQITYCQVITLEIKMFKQSYSALELADFFDSLVTEYAMWAKRLGDWVAIRDASAELLQFPFSAFRHGQRQLSVAVYKTLSRGLKLFAQAPTGTGKTMATIFPAIKALGIGHVEKLFFLTAKTVTRQLAEEAFARLRQAGLRCKTLTLTAKDKTCFMPEAACTPEECPYAEGYYDRINLALHDCWQREAFTREVIEQYAREHRVCPFELSLDLAFWADAVICDYNYVFDPRVYLKRFFYENNGQYCFLVDEAHNLVDRARDMFSAELTKQSFLDLKKNVNNKLPPLAKAAGKINTFLLKSGKLCIEKSAVGESDYCVREQPFTDILPLLRKFMDLAEKWLAKNEPADFREELLDIYFKVNAFLRTSETYDERYVTYVEKMDKDIKLKLFCVNPSELLRQAVQRGRAAVFFSATLTPLNYFSEVLGGEEGDGKITVPTPFDHSHLSLLVADNISTTYKTREKTYEVIVDSIAAAIGARAGNYLVFLPSYRYMEEVYQRFSLKNPLTRVIRQMGEMTEEERAGFLDQFSSENTDTLVGFAVLGGVFGEGIDLIGERLVGAVVVGVGLPKVCLEREIIRQWFDKDNRQGFEYAYVYPGMNKVLQAAGRVIRTEYDRGLVLLIDDRFSQSRYKRLFPPEWQGAVRTNSVSRIADEAKRFWMMG
ncbi:ATP-dependent DNA helicase [Sporomusa sp.]|uniref:ATP-dependent DNA helicase n=1 Tax=Sporomusa sp. TaxID=2078658 RepID=UPI002CE6E16E|nr:ATP-dependent DNA helicase [Sporomusa sp.]HWR45639.1 ATP-dependent DNA helicase [Sporomusa sp.]